MSHRSQFFSTQRDALAHFLLLGYLGATSFGLFCSGTYIKRELETPTPRRWPLIDRMLYHDANWALKEHRRGKSSIILERIAADIERKTENAELKKGPIHKRKFNTLLTSLERLYLRLCQIHLDLKDVDSACHYRDKLKNLLDKNKNAVPLDILSRYFYINGRIMLTQNNESAKDTAKEFFQKSINCYNIAKSNITKQYVSYSSDNSNLFESVEPWEAGAIPRTSKEPPLTIENSPQNAINDLQFLPDEKADPFISDELKSSAFSSTCELVNLISASTQSKAKTRSDHTQISSVYKSLVDASSRLSEGSDFSKITKLCYEYANHLGAFPATQKEAIEYYDKIIELASLCLINESEERNTYNSQSDLNYYLFTLSLDLRIKPNFHDHSEHDLVALTAAKTISHKAQLLRTHLNKSDLYDMYSSATRWARSVYDNCYFRNFTDEGLDNLKIFKTRFNGGISQDLDFQKIINNSNTIIPE